MFKKKKRKSVYMWIHLKFRLKFTFQSLPRSRPDSRFKTLLRKILGPNCKKTLFAVSLRPRQRLMNSHLTFQNVKPRLKRQRERKRSFFVGRLFPFVLFYWNCKYCFYLHFCTNLKHCTVFRIFLYWSMMDPPYFGNKWDSKDGMHD